jgi:drug/metabolite transporter (DMT)-like permease
VRTDSERLTLAAFLTGSVLAGGNAVGVRFSNRELDPFWGAGFRFALAATALAGVMAVLRLAPPAGGALRGAVLYGALNFGASFALLYYGLVRVHAGIAQTVLAIVPLATLLLAVLERQERFRTSGILGAILAIVGVAVMSQAPLEAGVPLLSMLALIGGAFCFAQAAILVHRLPPVHPVTLNALGMAVAAVLLLLASWAAGERIALPERAETWAAIAYLVVVGSMLVFVLYVFVLRRWSASRAAYTFVLIPIVTIALSAWLDDEPVGVGLGLGGLLVLAGVYVGALRRAT